MLQVMNASAPGLVLPRASPHDVTASAGVGPTGVQPASTGRRDDLKHFDANLSVEELISKLVQDCFDDAVHEDAAPTGRPDARARGATQTAVDACDSDSGVSMISDTAPASVGGDVAAVEGDAASQCSTPDVDQPVDVKSRRVMFGGRDILDLASTLADPKWRLQPTQLPPMNLEMFWKNRSQYHRLGDFGSTETHKEICCYACTFHFPVPPP